MARFLIIFFFMEECALAYRNKKIELKKTDQLDAEVWTEGLV